WVLETSTKWTLFTNKKFLHHSFESLYTFRCERTALQASRVHAGLWRDPIVLFCGDFHQFRPVRERSILLPSAAIPWDEDGSFTAEQRCQHDK
ncbi:hypothetical protein DL98DRAFT_660497, partial [Cadophora sp. DSE1049]